MIIKYLQSLFVKIASSIDLDALMSPWRLTKSEKCLIAKLSEQDAEL